MIRQESRKKASIGIVLYYKSIAWIGFVDAHFIGQGLPFIDQGLNVHASKRHPEERIHENQSCGTIGSKPLVPHPEADG
jgi:hypothetical protein